MNSSHRNILIKLVLFHILAIPCLAQNYYTPSMTYDKSLHAKIGTSGTRRMMIAQIANDGVAVVSVQSDSTRLNTSKNVKIIQPAQCLGAIALSRIEARALVRQIAVAQHFDSALALAVAKTESDFVSTESSPKGAYGLMQLMPSTASRTGVNICDPAQNVLGGIRELRALEAIYQNPLYVLAAYNAGNGAVTKFHGLPPYRETIGYVAKVLNHYFGWKQGFDPHGGHKPAVNADAVKRPITNQMEPQTGASGAQTVENIGSSQNGDGVVWKSGFVESFN
ncbi:MAG: lytic transglycosylase domain-containing protein [Hyphomicrobiales bacterium]|nr:lytic transglycosylase domain-containing protein [Hyphomicrobiales bacterium]MDE2115812.1 lytic transglycosylase domain-containing protein [Hyphomicrobiales bacterium]